MQGGASCSLGCWQTPLQKLELLALGVFTSFLCPGYGDIWVFPFFLRQVWHVLFR